VSSALSLSGVKVGWMFPGQGSQFPGMGAAARRHWPAAAEVFAKADRHTGLPVTEWSVHGPGSLLGRTSVTQLSVFTTSHALLAGVRARLRELDLPIDPLAAAGHSLGEINALVAAGALTFEAGLDFVRARGAAFEDDPAHHSGAMVAIIGLGLTQVQELCRRHDAEISNINSDAQYVVAADRRAVPTLCADALRHGARKATLLAISIASHSRWARNVSVRMQSVIDKLVIDDPRFPVVLNSSGKASEDAGQIREELRCHITAPVLWLESMRTVAALGAEVLLEIGPGQTLTRLASRIVNCPAGSVGASTPIRDMLVR
jgi:[acyl-carrier-protein] S-malonyltransferase